MTKLLRVLGIVVAVLVVLIVAAALILPQVIDPNNYRDRIAAAVKEKTGRELTIAGDIGWSVFPWLGVEIGETRLSNAAGFGDEPFARVAAMQVRVKLLPLLRKEVEMSTLQLDGLQVNLAKDKSGRTNWADLVPAETAPAQPKAEPASAGLPVAALAIGGVTVRDASLVWDDRQAGSRQQIDNLNLNIGEIRPGQPVDVALDFVAKSGAPVTTAQVKLGGQLALSESLKQIDVPNLKLSVAAQGESLPGGKIDADLSSQLAADLDRQTLDLKNLVLNVLGLKLHGQAQGTGIAGDKRQFAGTLKLDEFAPRDLLKTLGQDVPEVSDPAVLGKAAAEFAFKAGTDSARVDNLKLRLDDSNVTGAVGVNNFAAPAISFSLALDAIDLDRYLPPRKEGEVKAAPTPAQAAGGGAAALPVDTLRKLNLNGTLKIGQLKAYQMRSTDISVTLAAKDGLVRVHPASAKMYQGSYNGDITLDVRGKEPRYALNERVSGVQAGPMLTDMLGEAKVTGTANVAVKLTAAGNDPAAVRRSMNGNANFAFTDGTVKGLNVLGDIRKAYAVLRGKPAPADAGNQTDFSALTGTATITNGLVRNDDLLGKSPLMQVEGQGTADLNTEALDYRVTATLVDALEGEGELTGRPIPVRITGTFDQPKVGVDMQSALAQELKKRVEEKVQEKIEEKLQDKVQDKLKGLFGR
ncbi:MAG: AsmA family protein [Gammaproteobacteria bacterium]